MSQFFASGGQSIGASASASVLPMNTQGWFPMDGLVGSPCSLSRDFLPVWKGKGQGTPAAAATAKSRQSCPTLRDPIDGSPPGSPIPGILQVRILEWVAISFSNAWKWKVKVKSLSYVRLFVTPWTAAHQAPWSMGPSGQEYWRGVPLPSLREPLDTLLNRGNSLLVLVCLEFQITDGYWILTNLSLHLLSARFFPLYFDNVVNHKGWVSNIKPAARLLSISYLWAL